MKLEQKLRDLADVIYNKTLFEVIPETKAKVNNLLAKQEAFTKIVQVYIDATVKLLSARVQSYIEVYKDPEIFKLDLDEIMEELDTITKNQVEVIIRQHYFQYFSSVPTEEDHENRIRKSCIGKFNDILNPAIAEIRTAQMRLDVNNVITSKTSILVATIPDFSFISDSKYRDLTTRDYTGLAQLNPETSRKSIVILSGVIIEGLLIDALVTNGMPYNQAKNKKFEELINLATTNSIIKHDKLSHALRDFRNFVHPAKEIRESFTLSKADAEFSFAAVRVITEEIERWYKARTPATPPAPSIPATPTIP